ncbi:hypothetical protein [Vibrio casei]|uniref:hypothetical protein n=1 Tax=Vibrio casei TaxID=673372 RepID=UPI003F95D9EA
MTRPIIPEYTGTTPDRDQSQQEFSVNADDWLAYQAPLGAIYNDLAEFLNKYNYADGGFFTPTSGQQYPTVTEMDLNMYFPVVFPNATDTYTYTSGNLNGITVQNGTVLRFDNETSTWEYQQPFAGGVSQASFDSEIDRVDGEIADVQTQIINRNLWLNSSLSINQRELGIGDVAHGKYSFDRWRKVTDNMTMRQPVDVRNYTPSTVHTISMSDGSSRQVTSPASGNWDNSDLDVPYGLAWYKLEQGSVPTPWEKIDDVDDLLAYYQSPFAGNIFAWALMTSSGVQGTNAAINITYIKRMRATPTVVDVSFANCTLLGSPTVGMYNYSALLTPTNTVASARIESLALESEIFDGV